MDKSEYSINLRHVRISPSDPKSLPALEVVMKKVLFGLFWCVLFSSAPGSAQNDKLPKLTAEEIISKHIEAVGGKEKLSKFKSRIAIGTVKKENDPEGKMAIVSESPNRLSAVFILQSYDLKFIYDGQTGMMRPQLPRNFAAFDAKYREIVASGLMFNGISLYNLLLRLPDDAKLEAKGMKKVQRQDAYIVEVKRSKGEAMRLYFDASTFMWVRTDYGKAHVTREMRPFTNESVNQGSDEITVDFYIETSDFRDVEGVKLPFKFQQVVTLPIVRQSSSGTITGTITEYKHNERIDPAMFQ